ncbi:tryptophan-rich sensory protein [Sporosarcina sp. CAU 1771]
MNYEIDSATFGINYLGSSGFFNGMSQKDISDKYTTLLTPAGFAFSIWGVIYTLLFVTLVYFIVKSKDERVSKLVHMISPLFIISCVLNMGWIVLFSFEFMGLSTLFIIGMVIILLLIVEEIYKNRSEVPFVLAGISFTIYGSWVFIASILNTSIFLLQ